MLFDLARNPVLRLLLRLLLRIFVRNSSLLLAHPEEVRAFWSLRLAYSNAALASAHQRSTAAWECSLFRTGAEGS